MRRSNPPGKPANPHPADSPLGSVASRAAAWLRLRQERKVRERTTLISHVRPPNARETPASREESSARYARVQFGEWQEWAGGGWGRIVYVPHVWVKTPVEEVPRCPDCGAPFEKTEEFEGLVGYRASCMAAHDPG